MKLARTAACLLSVAAAGTLTIGATAAAAAPAGAALNWQQCGPLECATVMVPVDWSRPGGAQLALGVAELPAASQPAQGTLFVDAVEPDGVGSSAIMFAQEHLGFFIGGLPLAHNRLNIVVVDRRGFGTSDPLSCTVSADDPSVPDLPANPSALDQLLAEDRAVAQGCLGSGSLLDHLDTVSSARDLEAVRQALGVSKISYFGETDGGLLGATYAAMYPNHVAAMVLDGAADHQLPALPRLISAAQAGEDLFDRFAAWCHASSSCVLHGQDVGAEFDAVVAAANHGQLAGLTGQQIQVTTSHLVLGEHLIEWPLLGDAIAAALHGDPSVFLAFVDLEFADPGYTASRAAGCADFPARPADLLALAALSKQFPHLGGLSEWSDLAAVCAGWPIPAANPPEPLRVSGTPPILIVNTTHDSTTPYPWAVSLARSIAGSRLLTVDVSGHLGFDNSPGCAAKAEDAYLANGTLPPPGAVCPA